MPKEISIAAATGWRVLFVDNDAYFDEPIAVWVLVKDEDDPSNRDILPYIYDGKYMYDCTTNSNMIGCYFDESQRNILIEKHKQGKARK